MERFRVKYNQQKNFSIKAPATSQLPYALQPFPLRELTLAPNQLLGGITPNAELWEGLLNVVRLMKEKADAYGLELWIDIPPWYFHTDNLDTPQEDPLEMVLYQGRPIGQHLAEIPGVNLQLMTYLVLYRVGDQNFDDYVRPAVDYLTPRGVRFAFAAETLPGLPFHVSYGSEDGDPSYSALIADSEVMRERYPIELFSVHQWKTFVDLAEDGQ